MLQTLFSRLTYLTAFWLMEIIPAFASMPADTVITGTNTIRVNPLGCTESLLNLIVNGYEVGGLITSAAVLVTVPRTWTKTGKLPTKRVVIGSLFAASALSSPSLTKVALDALVANNFFS